LKIAEEWGQGFGLAPLSATFPPALVPDGQFTSGNLTSAIRYPLRQ